MPTPLRVLIVDDHALVADTVAVALNLDPRFRVVGTAATADAALALAPEADVVLLDAWLGTADGLVLLGLLAYVAPAARTFVLTATVDDGLRRRAEAAGAAGVLLKREPLAHLRQALVDAVGLPPEPDGHRRGLSDRELEVLRIAATGRTNREVGELLFISVDTVRNHMSSVLRKLGAHSKLEAVAIASQRGLITIDLV